MEDNDPTFCDFDYSTNGKLDGRKTDLAVMGVPFDFGSSGTAGQRAAPDRLRSYKDFAGFYLRDHKTYLDTFFDAVDVGDVFIDGVDGMQHLIDIEARATVVFKNTGCLLSFGGDHTVSHPLIKAMNNVEGQGNATVFVLDAHPDMWDDEPLAHNTWVRKVVNEGLAHTVRQWGTRGWNVGHADWQWAKRGNVVCYGPKQLDMLAVELDKVTGPLYVSIDIDSVDPAFAPAVSYRMPGGIYSREFIDICQLLGRSGKVRGIDFNEYVPDRDPHDLTGRLILHGALEFIVSHATYHLEQDKADRKAKAAAKRKQAKKEPTA
jgi:arginase family enzyme